MLICREKNHDKGETKKSKQVCIKSEAIMRVEWG